MSNTTQDTTELDTLKSRADLMGISYHPNISAERLAQRIQDRLDNPEEDSEEAPKAKVAPKNLEVTASRKSTLRAEAMKLVRVNITCMNPAKREWENEHFTVGNSVVGTVSRVVPFNTSDGWHVEQILLNMIQARKCQVFVDVKRNGVTVKESRLIKEFAVEILDPLTPKQLEELKRRQLMTEGKD